MWINNEQSEVINVFFPVLSVWSCAMMSKMSETEASQRLGRPVVRWRDRVKEYMHARGGDRGEDLYKQGVSLWLGREGGSSAVAISLWNVAGENEASETIYKQMEDYNVLSCFLYIGLHRNRYCNKLIDPYLAV